MISGTGLTAFQPRVAVEMCGEIGKRQVFKKVRSSCRRLTTDQSTESPILMPLFGPKTGFRARMNEIKSGIPCHGTDTPNLSPKIVLGEFNTEFPTHVGQPSATHP